MHNLAFSLTPDSNRFSKPKGGDVDNVNDGQGINLACTQGFKNRLLFNGYEHCIFFSIIEDRIHQDSNSHQMTLKFHTALLSVMLSCTGLSAQSVSFDYDNGLSSTYAIKDVRKITFSGDLMKLHLLNGAVFSWNVSTIDQYRYLGGALGLHDVLAKANALDFRVYPNPATNLLVVSCILARPEMISISIYDLSGRLMHQEQAQMIQNGQMNYYIDLSSFESGQYIVQIDGTSESFKQFFIKS